VKLLALDFDGVISDSAPEAFVVALRTYVAIRPAASARIRAACEEVDALLRAGADASAARERIVASEPYAPFVDAMPLGNRAEDFGFELAAIDARTPLPDQAAYDHHKRALLGAEPTFARDFHARFYRERDAFAASAPAAWLGLLGPYPEFVELLRRRRGRRRLGIATAKDRGAIDRLLAAYAIDDLFEPQLVLDKDTGTSKRAHLEALRARTGADFGDITFVDDKLNHLEDVAPLGVRCALAAWGYNAERERARASALGFAVCDLADADRILFA